MKKKSALVGIKKQVLQAPAYTLKAFDAEVKLNQNENPFDFPDDLKDETFRRFRDRSWSRYPDFIPDALHQSLAAFTGWNKDGILVGNGSNELLQASLTVLVNRRTRVAIPAPTFTVYRLICSVLGASVVDLPLSSDMSYDVDDMISRSREGKAGVMVVNTPNNPTGSALSEEGLLRILAGFDGYVLLDEAYIEFWGRSALKVLAEHPRLVITRTFSKAMGMAGLRIGYLMANVELATQIAKAKLPYNVNQFTLTAAQVALENIDRFRATVDVIIAERERLGRELASIPGMKVYPTKANFFLVEAPMAPRRIFDELYAQGILIRDVSSYPMLSKCLRISVGSREEDDRLLSALRGCLGCVRECIGSAGESL